MTFVFKSQYSKLYHNRLMGYTFSPININLVKLTENNNVSTCGIGFIAIIYSVGTVVCENNNVSTCGIGFIAIIYSVGTVVCNKVIF